MTIYTRNVCVSRLFKKIYVFLLWINEIVCVILWVFFHNNFIYNWYFISILHACHAFSISFKNMLFFLHKRDNETKIYRTINYTSHDHTSQIIICLNNLMFKYKFYFFTNEKRNTCIKLYCRYFLYKKLLIFYLFSR